MKFVPRHSQVVGRVVIKRMLHSIVRPDETKNTTKFVLLDAVGPEAAAAGLKVGDVVMPKEMEVIVLDGGTAMRPVLDEKNIRVVVTELGPDELVVQTENGSQYVPFDHKDAAKPLGGSPTPPASEAA